MTSPNYTYDKKRFETFIDAVIAIILTILVLELRVPESSHEESANTKQLLLTLLPSFMSYIGSFLLIVGIWIDHHILFLNIDKLNKRFILLNMLFMLLLSIIPFTTAFAGHYHDDSFAVALLFTNYFLMNVSFGSLYWYANMKNFLPPSFFSDNKATARYSMIGIAGLIIAIPLAYVNTYVSFTMGLLIFGVHLFKKK